MMDHSVGVMASCGPIGGIRTMLGRVMSLLMVLTAAVGAQGVFIDSAT
jgi:hypothetical protein